MRKVELKRQQKLEQEARDRDAAKYGPQLPFPHDRPRYKRDSWRWAFVPFATRPDTVVPFEATVAE